MTPDTTAILEACWRTGKFASLDALAIETGLDPEFIRFVARQNAWPSPEAVRKDLRDLTLDTIQEMQRTRFRGVLEEMADAISEQMKRVREYLHQYDEAARRNLGPQAPITFLIEMGNALKTGTSTLAQSFRMIDDLLGLKEAHRARYKGKSKDPVRDARPVGGINYNAMEDNP